MASERRRVTGEADCERQHDHPGGDRNGRVPAQERGMTRTIPVDHAVSTASTAAPAPKTSAITVAASPSVRLHYVANVRRESRGVSLPKCCLPSRTAQG
jgi:hypothetical protein